MSDFTVHEFVEYWEAKANDDALAIDWLGLQIQTEDGKNKLADVASVLADRHGATSTEVVNLRAAMFKAYKKVNDEREKEGHDPIERESFSIRKSDGVAYFHTPKKGGKKINPVKTAANTMRKWVEKGYTFEDIRLALETVEEESTPY